MKIEEFNSRLEEFELMDVSIAGYSIENDIKPKWIKEINALFNQIFQASYKNNIYFNYCGLKVYRNSFEIRYETKRSKKGLNYERLDFIKEEISNLSNQILFSLCNDTNSELIKEEAVKKLEYLKDKAQQLGVSIEIIQRPEEDIGLWQKSKVKLNYNEDHHYLGYNPYTDVFRDGFSYRLFQNLFDKFKDTKYPLADFSFIYRMMYKDKYIVASQRPEIFREWLSGERYDVILGSKFKTLDKCKTDAKIIQYNLIKAATKDN